MMMNGHGTGVAECIAVDRTSWRDGMASESDTLFGLMKHPQDTVQATATLAVCMVAVEMCATRFLVPLDKNVFRMTAASLIIWRLMRRERRE